MIKERRVLPNRLVVAIAALFAQRTVVRIVVQVTGVAVCHQFHCEYRFDVAVDAGDLLVPAKQLVVRVRVVIKERFGPRIAGVAGVALIAAMTIMLVIFKMAGRAGHIHLVLKRILGVAVATGEICMFEEQLKICVARMIEARVVPVGRVMAILTLLPGATFVNVVAGMTGKAGRRRVLVRLVLVAIPAFRLTMFADQREVRRVVIESRVGPAAGFVTIGTFAAEIALVNVVVAVTVRTFTRRITPFVAGFVAVGAGGLEVFAQQLEIRERVVKCGFIEPQNVGTASRVIGMAGSAGAVGNCARAAVKPGARHSIIRDILVAVEAQAVLRRSIEPFMTR